MSNKNNQAVKAVSFMMFITLAGKILGLVREQFLAANYGLGVEAGAFLIASRIPRTFFDAVFASAISASFIPIFNEYLKEKGREEAFGLANRFITLIFFITLGMTILGMVFADNLVWLFAGGYDYESAQLTATLSRMLFPTIMFTAVAFSFVGILQSLEEFNVPAAISVASNSVIILYYVFFNDRFGVYGLTVAFLIAWAMQAIIQIPSLRKKGYHYRPDFAFKKDDGLRKIGKMMLPVMVSTWIQPINFMINSRFASQLVNGEQNVSVLEYANTLYTIIVGVFVLAIANLIFPKLSRISGESNKEEFSDTLKVTLRSMMFLLIPMMVGLMSLAEPLVRLVYERKDFTPEATVATGIALFFFSIGMIGYGVQTILSRAFYAKQDGKIPFYSGLVSIVINAVLCFALMGRMGLAGLALSAAISSTAAAVVLLIPTVRKYPKVLELPMLKSLGKMAISAVGMLVFVVVSHGALAKVLGDSLVARILLLGIPTGIGILSYMVFAYLLKIEEAQMVAGFLKKLFSRGGKNGGSKGDNGNSGNGEQKERQVKHKNMVQWMSEEIEDSFCFIIIAKIFSTLAAIWTSSYVYGLYAKFANAVGKGFLESGVLGFARKNFDEELAVRHGLLPRFWSRLLLSIAKAFRQQRSVLAIGMQESTFFRIMNQNFIILCFGVLVLAIPILPTMLLVLLCLGILCLYAINLLMGRIHVQKTTLVSLFMGLFGVVLAYASITSYNFPKALQVLAVFLVFMSMFFVAKDVVDTEEKLDFLLFVMISAGVLIALYALYQYFIGVEIDEAWVDADAFSITTRAYSTFSNPNVLGEYLIIIASLAAGMLWKVRNWFGRIFYVACFGILCLGLLATNSRGSMLGLLFSAGLFVLLAERRLIPLGIAGVMAMPFFLPASIWARLISSVTMNDSSSLYRLSIYDAGIDMVEKFWTTGIGVDSFNELYPLFAKEAANAYHVHNIFLQELIELGFFGFAVMLLLFILFFQKLYGSMQRVPKRFRMLLAAFFGGFAGLLLQGMTDHIWFDYRIVLLFWCFIGLGLATVRVGEKQWKKER